MIIVPGAFIAANMGDTGLSSSWMFVKIRGSLQWISSAIAKHTASLKILITHSQIITALPSVLHFDYPVNFSEILQKLSIVNLDILKVFALGCTMPVNFHVELLVMTLGPIGLSLLVLLAYFVVPRVKKYHIDHTEIKSKCMSVFIWITYLAFPSVSTKLFQAFSYEEIDSQYYLTSDYRYKPSRRSIIPRFNDLDVRSVDYMSKTHKFFQAYAAIMILVYPIGIPLMYFVLLRRHRNELVPKDWQKDPSVIVARNENPKIKHLAMLYQHYIPSCW